MNQALSTEAVGINIDENVRKYIDFALAQALSKEPTPGFKLFASHPDLVPTYSKLGNSGFDLRANIATSITVQPGTRRTIATGLWVEMPVGYEMQIRPRSGRAHSEGCTVLNAPGTIDANFRGEIGVIFINHGQDPVTIQPMERIAQGVITRVECINWTLVEAKEELTPTDRGAGGFGSSGKN